MHRRVAISVIVVAAAFGPPLTFAQQQAGGAADADALAKQLSNPVASLISVPLQLNYDEGLGPDGAKEPTASGWIWGVGPAFLLPTASKDTLGTEQWAIGPTAVVLKQTETGWTYGALTNYLLSVAGNVVYSQVSRAGNQLLSYAVGARYYLESPAGGPDWGVRFVVTLLYPR